MRVFPPEIGVIENDDLTFPALPCLGYRKISCELDERTPNHMCRDLVLSDVCGVVPVTIGLCLLKWCRAWGVEGTVTFHASLFYVVFGLNSIWYDCVVNGQYTGASTMSSCSPYIRNLVG